MALTFDELEAITSDYFMADNKKAIDIYFSKSFIIDRWMNKKKALWDRPNGGKRIMVPLVYDIAEGGSFSRNSTLSSDDKEILNAAYFLWKHYYGNATLFLTDELEATGEHSEVSIVTSKIQAAQNKITKDLSQGIYGSAGDSAEGLTGFLSLFNTTGSTAFGHIAEDDLVASDGTKPWKANLTSTTEAIGLSVLRTMASAAKVDEGVGTKPNIGVMPETLLNVIKGILQAQQRFTQDSDTVKAGYTNLVFEEMVLAADDYCPSGYAMLFNERFVGFAVHAAGYFKNLPWADLLVAGKAARAMKIMWHGNMVCNNRKAHIAHSNLS